MAKPLIMVSSITYAMKGKELLNEKGFRANVVRTPKKQNITGCGYSIEVQNKVDEAESILKSHNIPILGIINEDDTT